MRIITMLVAFTVLVTPYVSADKTHSVNLNQEINLRTNIENYQGQSLTILLNNGDELSGKVQGVSKYALVLKGIKGREYYDALVLLKDISAVIAKPQQIKK